MPDDRETPNPFQSPRTVATGEVPAINREAGPRVRDLKHQTLGFAFLAATSLVAIGVALGAIAMADALSLAPPWDWLDTVLRVATIVCAVVGVPTLLVCLPWTVVSAGQWAMASRAGYQLKSEAGE